MKLLKKKITVNNNELFLYIFFIQYIYCIFFNLDYITIELEFDIDTKSKQPNNYNK
jgi:hypothetical protein